MLFQQHTPRSHLREHRQARENNGSLRNGAALSCVLPDFFGNVLHIIFGKWNKLKKSLKMQPMHLQLNVTNCHLQLTLIAFATILHF
jgi:hypothetical protein